jgi:hypothetical protein
MFQKSVSVHAVNMWVIRRNHFRANNKDTSLLPDIQEIIGLNLDNGERGR